MSKGLDGFFVLVITLILDHFLFTQVPRDFGVQLLIAVMYMIAFWMLYTRIDNLNKTIVVMSKEIDKLIDEDNSTPSDDKS